ncbi:MAG: sulfatase [Eubacteriales bacterium]
MKQPNILFAIADDASHFGAYGDKFVHTPHFDAIAKEGVLFENSFCTNPKCAPSRASILSGKHTWQLESGCTHFCEFPKNVALFPDLLEQAGFHVGFTGKGWGPGDYECNGYKRNPAGNEYNSKSLTPPEGSSISTIDYVGNFKDFLEDRNENQPFYFWYGCKEPHRVYTDGEGLSHGKKLEDITVPSYLPDNEVVRSDFCDYAFEIDWFDQKLGEILDYLKEIGEYDNTLIVVTSDNGAPFPRIKGQMYEDDFNLPLAISWQNKVKGGRKVSDIVSFIDFAPTFLELAEAKTPESMGGTSLTDILFSQAEGQVNLKRNRAYMGRERHDMGRYLDQGYPVRSIRSEKYLYSRNFEPSRYPAGNPDTNYPNCDPSPTKREILLLHANRENFYYNLSFGLRPEEELFDIQNDPECMKNLAKSPAFQKIKEDLFQELMAELKRTGDPRAFGHGDIFDTYRYVKDAPHAWYNLEKKYWARADEVGYQNV